MLANIMNSDMIHNVNDCDVACQSFRASLAHSVKLAMSCTVQILNFENYYLLS